MVKSIRMSTIIAHLSGYGLTTDSWFMYQEYYQGYKLLLKNNIYLNNLDRNSYNFQCNKYETNSKIMFLTFIFLFMALDRL